MVEVKYCVETAVMGALAQALGGRVTGDLKGGGNHCYVGGPDPKSGETFIFYEYPAGGTGAYEGGDGNNTVRAWTESDMTTSPIRPWRSPVRIESTALREDSGGPGRLRGGLGLRREVRIRTAGSSLSVLAERAVLPPFGVSGGGAGATNHFWVRRGDRAIEPSPLPGKVGGFPIEPEDVVVMDSSGGGGCDLSRDFDAVVRPRRGYVTCGRGSVYGVVLAAARSAAKQAPGATPRGRGRECASPLCRASDQRGRPSDSIPALPHLGGRGRRDRAGPAGAPLRAWV
jgi:N-methylhydantoinase B